jgi:hypothetical protein
MKRKENYFPNEYVETDLTKALKGQKPFIVETQIMVCQRRYEELLAKEEKLRLLEKAIKSLDSSYSKDIQMLQEII